MNQPPLTGEELGQLNDQELTAELERLGDQCLTAEQRDEACEYYSSAAGLIVDVRMDKALQDCDDDAFNTAADDLRRIRGKAHDASLVLAPTPSPVERVWRLRDAIESSIEDGDLIYAARASIDLGDILSDDDHTDAAESAYRQAVVLARQVDAQMPDLMLWAFSALIEFLEPSEESIALAQELGKNLIERNDMYHPMRAAEAALCWAYAELNFAEHQPHRIDYAINSVARQAMEMLDGTCLHDQSQHLQRGVAEILRRVGHDIEADYWQNKADEYEDWEPFMDQQIPGHVHLWDIRVDVGS